MIGSQFELTNFHFSISIMLQALVTVLLLACSCTAIPIDNAVLDPIEVECSADMININFNTEKPWGGALFAKNHFTTDGCKVTGSGRGNLGSISLPFDQCGVTRERSLNPRGVFVRAHVIMSFHATFVTKVDRSVRVQCFYMEADKTVSQDLEVSVLPTELETINVPMPNCRYEVLDAPDGQPIKFALIGQAVHHKWTCDSNTNDIFCATVHSCTVDDGNGDTIELLDGDGCAIDFNILDNLDYPSDLMAIKEAHVFKYADRASLYFSCQINIIVKEPGDQCLRPVCGTPARGSRGGRQRRQLPWYAAQNKIGTIDVSPENEILVGDVELTEQDIPFSLLSREARLRLDGARLLSSTETDDLCLSSMSSSVGLTIVALLLISSALMAGVICMKST